MSTVGGQVSNRLSADGSRVRRQEVREEAGVSGSAARRGTAGDQGRSRHREDVLGMRFRAAEQDGTATLARWVGHGAVRDIIDRHKDDAEGVVYPTARHLTDQKQVTRFCWYTYGIAGIGPDWQLRRDAPWMLDQVEQRLFGRVVTLFRTVVRMTVSELADAGVPVVPAWAGDHATVGEMLLLDVPWDLPAEELAEGLNSPGNGALEVNAGRSDSPPDSRYWAYTAVLVMLSGGAGLDMGTVGSLARAMAPVGGIAPIAGQVEYRWPISPADERDNAPDDEDILALLGTSDLRDNARNLAMTTPAAELRDAYQVTAAMTASADAACTAVEQEIASGQPGDAVAGWATIAFGPARLMMAVMLRDKDAEPASTAGTAMMLVIIRNMLRAVRQLIPDANFDVLRNPMVAPSFLVDFLAR
jgi:hypothetical protein